MKKIGKRALLLLLALATIALVVISFLPSPLQVETTSVKRGPLQVTIDEEGETRAHDRFVVAAPVAGQLARIELHEGDSVKRGQVVALLHPLPLDPQRREEALARIQGAEASQREAEQRAEHARADFEQAERERIRAERLARDGLVSTQTLEQAKSYAQACASELDAAKFRVSSSAADVRVTKAALMAIEAERNAAAQRVELRAPVAGRVLRLLEQSERAVAAGTALLTLGDAKKLEIVVAVLSTDAVKVKPGMAVRLVDWGGEQELRARVRMIESSAFTKVSALGVEEQRVNLLADFVDPPGALGDGYRVEARIVIWESADVVKIASRALFRQGEGWAVFVIEGGKAKRRSVQIGHRGAVETEIVNGLEEGEIVVLHPTNELSEGLRVEAR